MEPADILPQRLLLIAGTRDGLFAFERRKSGAEWRCSGPYLEGLDVSHAKLDPRDGRTIFAAATGNGSTAVYRSDDSGDSLHVITSGLPSNFGFVIGITRQHPPAVFVVPQDENNIRLSGQLTVYRTRDGGNIWEALTNGLPEVERVTLYREGMTTDHLDPAGVYFGTSEGTILSSSDTGGSWSRLVEELPPIRSLTIGVPA